MIHKLKKARFELEITQDQLAKKISQLYGKAYQSYLSDVEAFNVAPRVLKKNRIVAALNEIAREKGIKKVYDLSLFDHAGFTVRKIK